MACIVEFLADMACNFAAFRASQRIFGDTHLNFVKLDDTFFRRQTGHSTQGA